MNIYLAARWPRRLELHAMRSRIQDLGHTVTSGWLDEINDTAFDAAERDLADIRRADVVVMAHDIALPVERLYGGCFVEMGYALGIHKPVWVVQETPTQTVFFHLLQVTMFESWSALYRRLER